MHISLANIYKITSLTYPSWISFDSDNNSYVIGNYGGISKFDRFNRLITSTAYNIYEPFYQCVNDSNNNLFVSTYYNLIKFDSNLNYVGEYTLGDINLAVVIDSFDYIYVNSYYGGYLYKYNSLLNFINSVSVYEYNFLTVIDKLDNLICVEDDGYSTTANGLYVEVYNTSLALIYRFSAPAGIYYWWTCGDNLGNFWILCSNNTIVKYTAAGILLLVVSTSPLTHDIENLSVCTIQADLNGNIYLNDGNDNLFIYSNSGILLYSYKFPSLFSGSLITNYIYSQNSSITFIDRMNNLIATGVIINDPLISIMNNSKYNQINCVTCNNNHKRGKYYD